MIPQVHVGTSGWQYRHWRGVFYPPGLASARWLNFYVSHFKTLELNVTFYRQVDPNTYEKWRDSVPGDFLFSAKMSRYITHIRRLHVDASAVKRFIDAVTCLSDRLGVVLIQLPPSLKFDQDLILAFFDLLDPRLRYTVEARNKSFLCDGFFQILSQRNMAWCIVGKCGAIPLCRDGHRRIHLPTPPRQRQTVRLQLYRRPAKGDCRKDREVGQGDLRLFR